MTRQAIKPIKKISALRNIFRKSNEHKKQLVVDKSILHRIFHPDYILFDWEYFSRDLEFE